MPVKVGNNSGVTPLSGYLQPSDQIILAGDCALIVIISGYAVILCSGKKNLLMADEEEVTGQSGDGDQDDAKETGSGRVHILIDNGRTRTFVQPRVVERIHLPITECTRLDQGEVLEGFQHEQGLLLFQGHEGSKKKIGDEIQRRIWEPRECLCNTPKMGGSGIVTGALLHNTVAQDMRE
ncbi:hypothetical protein Tco_1025653 [Tanacetum coccineum]